MLTNDERIEIIAAACHAAWYAYAVISLGENGGTWKNTPEQIRESARDGVKFQMSLSNETGLHKRCSASHENWFAFKKAEGWTWGPEKSVDRKTNPCMVPYEELSESQRKKDSVFVETFLQMSGILDEIDKFRG